MVENLGSPFQNLEDKKMQSKKKRIVYVATRAELMNEHYYWRLWLVIRNMLISRRNWLEELSLLFANHPDVIILYRSRETFIIPFVDDVFANDHEMRWMSYYLEQDDFGIPRRKARNLERLQLLDLFIKIKYPSVARHFGK